MRKPEWNDTLYNAIALVLDANDSKQLDDRAEQTQVIEALVEALDYKTLIQIVNAHPDCKMNVEEGPADQPLAVLHTNVSFFELDLMFPLAD